VALRGGWGGVQCGENPSPHVPMVVLYDGTRRPIDDAKAMRTPTERSGCASPAETVARTAVNTGVDELPQTVGGRPSVKRRKAAAAELQTKPYISTR